MKRRDFLKAVAGLAATAALPISAMASEGLTLADLRAAVFVLKRNAVTEPLTGYVHVSVYDDLVALAARGEWVMAYRRARLAGDGGLPATEILAKYPVQRLTAEMGRIEGVRFIESTG